MKCQNSIILLGDKDPLALPEPNQKPEVEAQEEDKTGVQTQDIKETVKGSIRYIRDSTSYDVHEVHILQNRDRSNAPHLKRQSEVSRDFRQKRFPRRSASSSKSKRDHQKQSCKWVVDPISIEENGLYYNESNPDPNEFYLDPFSKRGQEKLSPSRNRSRGRSSRGTSRGQAQPRQL